MIVRGFHIKSMLDKVILFRICHHAHIRPVDKNIHFVRHYIPNSLNHLGVKEKFVTFPSFTHTYIVYINILYISYR
jgi:hypothetical protein